VGPKWLVVTQLHFMPLLANVIQVQVFPLLQRNHVYELLVSHVFVHRKDCMQLPLLYVIQVA